MAKNIRKIAEALGAKIVAEVPETGGGAFGAFRLNEIVSNLRMRLEPSQGKRAGRPTDTIWIHHPKIPMSEETAVRLEALANLASSDGRRVSPMQMAAQLLELAVSRIPASEARGY